MSVSDEIRRIMVDFVANPPFPKDEDAVKEFAGMVSGSPDITKKAAQSLLLDVIREWISVGLKAAMAYGMLGIDLKMPEETPFIKKLMEE